MESRIKFACHPACHLTANFGSLPLSLANSIPMLYHRTERPETPKKSMVSPAQMIVPERWQSG